MSGELERAWLAAEQAWRRKWAVRKPEEEPTFRYVVEFECTPSTFDHIQRVIATQRTFNRLYRYYAASKDDKGAVIKTWQNRT